MAHPPLPEPLRTLNRDLAYAADRATRQVLRKNTMPKCSDCGAEARTSTFTNDAKCEPRAYCDDDWYWRQARLLEHDPRPRTVLEREVA